MAENDGISHLSRVRLDCFNQVRMMNNVALAPGEGGDFQLADLIRRSRLLEDYITEDLNLEDMGANASAITKPRKRRFRTDD